MIIDCHVHLNNYNLDEHHPTADNCAALFDEMNARGVDHAVVITSYTIDCDRPGVQDVLMVLHGDPRTTIVEGLRWRSDHRSDLYTMEERIRAGVVKGIKLYPGYEPYAINDPSLESVYRLAGKYDVPVMIHTGDTYSKRSKVRNAHPLLVDDVAVDFPEVTFVMCHAGNPWFTDAAEVLYKNDNVFADISGLTLGQFTAPFQEFVLARLKDMILYMGDAGGKLLYGSDWPLVQMGPYLQLLDDLVLPDEQKQRLAWKTAARLFTIDVDATEKAVRSTAAFRRRPPSA